MPLTEQLPGNRHVTRLRARESPRACARAIHGMRYEMCTEPIEVDLLFQGVR